MLKIMPINSRLNSDKRKPRLPLLYHSHQTHFSLTQSHFTHQSVHTLKFHFNNKKTWVSQK